MNRVSNEPNKLVSGSAPIRLHSYAYALSLSMRWGRITEGKTIFLSSLYNHAPPPIKIEEFAPFSRVSVSDSQTIQPFSLLGEVCRCAQVTVQQQTTTMKKRNTPFCARTVRCATVLVFSQTPFLCLFNILKAFPGLQHGFPLLCVFRRGILCFCRMHTKLLQIMHRSYRASTPFSTVILMIL